MRSHDALKNEEANQAAWEASKGGLLGAAKWGVVTGAISGLAWYASPVYRGLTIQFKVYLQMAGMVFGGMVEAEWRLQHFEAQMRLRRKVMAEQARWEAYEQELADEDAVAKKR